MSVANLVLQYVRVLVWPVVVVIAVVAFRHEARGLLRRLKTLGAPGFNAEFESETALALQTARAVVGAEVGGTAAEPGSTRDGDKTQEAYELIRTVAQGRPFEAFSTAWRLVEFKIMTVVEPETIELARRPKTIGRMISILGERGVDEPTIEFARELYQLSKEAFHEPRVVTQKSAVEFIEAAQLLADHLDTFIKSR